MTAWTKDIPTEPGAYWFYGEYFWGEMKKIVVLIHVRGHQTGVYYASEFGEFFYPHKASPGWWTPAIIPELPEDK